jgi:hypothetical protein
MGHAGTLLMRTAELKQPERRLARPPWVTWRTGDALPGCRPVLAKSCLARGNVNCPAASEATPRRESHRTGWH